MTDCHGQHSSSLVVGPFFVSETAYHPGLSLSKHRHPTSCLHCVVEGEYDEETNGQRVAIGPGQSLFKPLGLQASFLMIQTGHARRVIAPVFQALESLH